jgi:predicted nucleic acid-binding protein
VIKLVIDASVAVKWFVRDTQEEKDVTSAVDILIGVGKNSIELIQPPHWMAEVIAVLARLQPDLTDDAIDLLDAMEIPTRAESSMYRLASHLAIELNHHLFDTLYHALALQDNATLLTADHRYFRKSANHGSICMLANFDLDT